MNKTCTNCYYYDTCKERIRCEYYDPLVDLIEDESDDNYILQGYKESLREREEDYRAIVDEIGE